MDYGENDTEKTDFVMAWGGFSVLLIAALYVLLCGCHACTGDPIVSPNHEPSADVPSVPKQQEPHVPYVPWWVKEKE